MKRRCAWAAHGFQSEPYHRDHHHHHQRGIRSSCPNRPADPEFLNYVPQTSIPGCPTQVTIDTCSSCALPAPIGRFVGYPRVRVIVAHMAFCYRLPRLKIPSPRSSDQQPNALCIRCRSSSLMMSRSRNPKNFGPDILQKSEEEKEQEKRGSVRETLRSCIVPQQ